MSHRRLFLLAFTFSFAFFWAVLAYADSLVVASCGTLPLAYSAGATRLDTVDVNGVKCTSSSGGGGGSVTQGTVPWVVSGQGTAGTAATGVLTVQGIASMTKLLVTPDSVALPANQSVNTAQVNGVTTLTGTGATGTGAQRVTVATDTATIAGSAPGTAGTASANVLTVQGIASMTPLTVTGAAGTFPVTQSTSPWIVAGGGTAGTAATGVVTVQGIASMTKLLVTPDSVALPANQSVNVAQVNGVTTLTGTGATGTGAQRMTISTDQATNAGAALVKGGVGVVNGGSTYQAVAASQTATVLQVTTGAIGDYLSHCVLYPTSTSPGVVTVFDNTNAAAGSAILFPGGASSLSNLSPIAIPVGAVSTAGAWKVTTGASISVVCYGKFS